MAIHTHDFPTPSASEWPGWTISHGGDPSAFSVAGNAGLITQSTSNSWSAARWDATAAMDEVDYTTTISVSNLGGVDAVWYGDLWSHMPASGGQIGYNLAINWYGGTLWALIFKADSSGWNFKNQTDTGQPFPPGDYKVRMMVRRETSTRRRVYGKVWPASSAEPGTWTVTWADTAASTLAAGYIGLGAEWYTSGSTTTTYSDLTLNDFTPVDTGSTGTGTLIGLESPHPYDFGETHTWVYTHPTAVDGLLLRFSDDEDLAFNDKLEVQDGAGTTIATYFGDDAAGQTVGVPGNVVRLILTSYGYEATLYGFRVTHIMPYTDRPDIADPPMVIDYFDRTTSDTWDRTTSGWPYYHNQLPQTQINYSVDGSKGAMLSVPSFLSGYEIPVSYGQILRIPTMTNPFQEPTARARWMMPQVTPDHTGGSSTRTTLAELTFVNTNGDLAGVQFRVGNDGSLGYRTPTNYSAGPDISLGGYAPGTWMWAEISLLREGSASTNQTRFRIWFWAHGGTRPTMPNYDQTIFYRHTNSRLRMHAFSDIQLVTEHTVFWDDLTIWNAPVDPNYVPPPPTAMWLPLLR